MQCQCFRFLSKMNDARVITHMFYGCLISCVCVQNIWFWVNIAGVIYKDKEHSTLVLMRIGRFRVNTVFIFLSPLQDTSLLPWRQAQTTHKNLHIIDAPNWPLLNCMGRVPRCLSSAGQHIPMLVSFRKPLKFLDRLKVKIPELLSRSVNSLTHICIFHFLPWND